MIIETFRPQERLYQSREIHYETFVGRKASMIEVKCTVSTERKMSYLLEDLCSGFLLPEISHQPQLGLIPRNVLLKGEFWIKFKLKNVDGANCNFVQHRYHSSCNRFRTRNRNRSLLTRRLSSIFIWEWHLWGFIAWDHGFLRHDWEKSRTL